MMRKRAQSALEFLTTYGWAFLVILIMIGALAYFGVLDPSRFLPDKCNFGQGMGCVDQFTNAGTTTFDGTADPITTDSYISVQLVNNFGKQITLDSATTGISSVTITGLSTACAAPVLYIKQAAGTWVDLTDGTADDFTWAANEQREVAVGGCTITAGERPKAIVQLAYQEAGSQYAKTTTGEIAVSAQ